MHNLPDRSFAGLLPTHDIAFAEELARVGEQQLVTSRHLSRATYTTARFLNPASSSSRREFHRFAFREGAALVCESSSETVQRYCAEHGLELDDDPSVIDALPTVSEALTRTIEPVPFLRSAVAALAWRCHLVCAPEDSYDVSFSDPQIPFSIFVSVPHAKKRSSSLRVAENLVHETMHLMLSLFECKKPLLVSNPSASLYSPWKREQRPAQGILHGLYVFSILRWMWKGVAHPGAHVEDAAFARQRIFEIDEEISAVQALLNSPALTPVGREFVSELLAFARQPGTSA